VGGNDSHVVFGKNSLVRKEVRRVFVVTQQPVLLSPTFGAKSSHMFTQSPYNFTVVRGLDSLAWQ
jgi:hypothetical protein